MENLEAAGVCPVEFCDPKVNVFAVKQLNILRKSSFCLGPVQTVSAPTGIERVGCACHVMSGTERRLHGHPGKHVVGLG